MTSEGLASYLLTVLILELTPGPNMAWLALLTATAGRRAGAAAVAGIALGLGLQGVLSALGVAALLQAVPKAFTALHLAGVAYLLWLAWGSWRDANTPAHHLPGGGEDGAAVFQRGLVSNLLNPKAALFFVAVLPGFLTRDAGMAETLTLSVVYLAVATGVHAAIVLAAGGLQGWLADPAVSVRMHRLQALALCAVAAWLLWRG